MRRRKTPTGECGEASPATLGPERPGSDALAAPDALADNVVVADRKEVRQYLFLTNQITVTPISKAANNAGISGLDFNNLGNTSELLKSYNVKLVGTTGSAGGDAWGYFPHDDAHRRAYQRIFERLGLEIVIVRAQSGPMGGSRSEEFLHPTEIGEDTFVRSPGGYAANVEAVTTVAPEPVDASGTPAAHVEHTPDSPTIQSLVDQANALHPKAEGSWSAADTLKNLLVVVTLPDGQRRVVAVGVPGDRAVDMKRLEVSLASALGVGGEVEVEQAGDEQLRAYPQLVKGYIGPGLAPDAAVLGEDSETGIPYFVDPRVVEGSAWITGANLPGQHVFDLVVGRDFTPDGVVEACEVREGDPAPDGSGPLSTARGIEMGHIFQLGRKYAEALGLKVLDSNGKLVTVTMGSYGVGVTRALAAIAEANHDEKGLIWPRNLAPADVHVVVAGKGEEILAGAEQVVEELEEQGLTVLFDDRPKVSPGVKFGDAELLGVPTILVIGRGFKDGKLELKDRRTGATRDIDLEDAARTVALEVRGD